MKRLVIYLIIFGSYFFLSCKKETHNKVQESSVDKGFHVRLMFINHDTSLKVVNLELYLSRPGTNKDEYGCSYINQKYYDPNFLGPAFKDTITHYDKNKLYDLGCLRTATIVVKCKIPLNPLTNNNMKYYEYTSASDPKNFDKAVDEIKSKNDTIIYFNWPKDTVKFTKVAEGEYFQ